MPSMTEEDDSGPPSLVSSPVEQPDQLPATNQQTASLSETPVDVYHYIPAGDEILMRYDIKTFLWLWQQLGLGSLPHISHDPVWQPELPPSRSFWARQLYISSKYLGCTNGDFQGINWCMLGPDVTRESVRSLRSKIYSAMLAKSSLPSLADSPASAQSLTRSPMDFFHFRRMATLNKVTVAHYQLRHLMSATSFNDIYYVHNSKIGHAVPWICNEQGSLDDLKENGLFVADRLKHRQTHTALSLVEWDSSPQVDFPAITTMAAAQDVIVAGGRDGEYSMRSLRGYGDGSHSPTAYGTITNSSDSSITNHVQIFSPRTNNSPHVAFCSNDARLRVLDCTTNRFINSYGYDSAMNCSVMSPHGRLRAVVGDASASLITEADTGRILVNLDDHTADVFACAWSDDEIHVATGAQDCRVLVYDARRWDQPVADILSEMACPRSLHFSPLGSGSRVLVVGEAEDNVVVVDAQTFEQSQVLHSFGPIGGVDFSPDGQNLFVANADAEFGGIIHYERATSGREFIATGQGNYEAWGDGNFCVGNNTVHGEPLTGTRIVSKSTRRRQSAQPKFEETDDYASLGASDVVDLLL